MISFLKGTVEDIEENYAVLDVGGVGYEVYMPAGSLDQIAGIGSEVKIYTHLQVSDNGVGLFGFLTKDDRKVFRLLITVSGIGPKGAAGILSSLSADDLRLAVLSDDSKAIARAPGIGPKTAKKVILELKDKFSLEETLEHIGSGDGEALTVTGDLSDGRQEAIQALTALGYSNSDALRAVRMVEHGEEMDVETLLKASLKHLTFL